MIIENENVDNYVLSNLANEVYKTLYTIIYRWWHTIIPNSSDSSNNTQYQFEKNEKLLMI